MGVKREATETGRTSSFQSLNRFARLMLRAFPDSTAVYLLGSSKVQRSKFKVRASRILSFEGSLQELRKILHFAQDKP
jgi:hypothetical protein